MKKLLLIVCFIGSVVSLQAQNIDLKPWLRYVIELRVRQNTANACSQSLVVVRPSLTKTWKEDSAEAKRELFKATHPLLLSTANQREIEQVGKVTLTTKQKQKIINRQIRRQENANALGDLVFDVLGHIIFKDE